MLRDLPLRIPETWRTTNLYSSALTSTMVDCDYGAYTEYRLPCHYLWPIHFRQSPTLHPRQYFCIDMVLFGKLHYRLA